MKLHRLTAFLLALLLLISCAAQAQEDDEGDVSYSEAPPRAVLLLDSPKNGQTWEKGGKLTLKARCDGAQMIVATLRFPDGNEWMIDTGSLGNGGEALTWEFAQDAEHGNYFTTGAVLTVTATMPNGDETTQTLEIISPREQLIRDMFNEALANSTDKRYRFAPAQEDWHVGVCKNFVMRLFDTYKAAYRMAEYPALELYMPKNKSKKDSAPYDYGIEWRPEGPKDGAPFEVAAQFKYDQALSKEENMALCREVLHSVKRGDFFQMVGYYYYGNGPHSLLFMADYDPVTDEEHWTDSNMKGERVDGVRWGYLQYDAVKTAEWFVEAICTKNRGCTIYRLRDDLFVK